MMNFEFVVGGWRKFKEVMMFVDKVCKGDIIVEGDGWSGVGGFSVVFF